MESNNFENQLKSKLEERRLQPSAEAWQRVAAHKTRAKKRPPGWIILAAALLIGVALFYMIPGQKIEVQQKVVLDRLPETKLETVRSTVETAAFRKEKIRLESNKDIARSEDGIIRTEDTLTEAPGLPTVVPTEDQKVDEIIASLQKIQDNGQDITEATLDSLLEKARRDIALDRQAKGPTNATALLRETEMEMDMSFKDRVFAAISKFKKIKIALGSDKP